MGTVFKIMLRGKQSTEWYAKVKVAPGQWERKKLFRDKTASQRRLNELQNEADQRAAGILTADAQRLALPLPDLIERYIDSLRAANSDSEHIKITRWSLLRLAEHGWLEVVQRHHALGRGAPAAVDVQDRRVCKLLYQETQSLCPLGAAGRPARSVTKTPSRAREGREAQPRPPRRSVH